MGWRAARVTKNAVSRLRLIPARHASSDIAAASVCPSVGSATLVMPALFTTMSS